MTAPDPRTVTEVLARMTYDRDGWIVSSHRAQTDLPHLARTYRENAETLTPTVIALMESYAAVRVREALNAAGDAIEAGRRKNFPANDTSWFADGAREGFSVAARIVRSRESA